MKSAIKDLAQLSDERLFDEISEGISHIRENAMSLEEAAKCLVKSEHYRIAKILSSLAEEEAAKVLVLVDVVRCPPNQSEAKGRTLKYFDNHFVKRIYAKLCSYHFTGFADTIEAIEHESQEFYLDGPNNVDWIFPNSVSMEREGQMYVDYVKDATTEGGSCSWNTPLSLSHADVYLGTHIRPESIEVSRALYQIGATTPEGLAVVADVWRKFEPTPETRTEELTGIKNHMLERLPDKGLLAHEDPRVMQDLYCWPFPLWSLQIGISGVNLDELRRNRREIIRRRSEAEAKREPPPTISRKTVETLNDAYNQFEKEMDELIDRLFPPPKPRIITLNVYRRAEDLDSYKRLKRMVLNLTDEERADLVALAWFARPEVIDWSATYKRAHTQIRSISYEYEIGLGSKWLIGLNRWKRKPRRFEAGRLHG